MVTKELYIFTVKYRSKTFKELWFTVDAFTLQTLVITHTNYVYSIK